MNRLTEGDEQGNWMLKGVAWKSLHTGQVITKEVSERLYGALCKLRDYEESGLNPDEVRGGERKAGRKRYNPRLSKRVSPTADCNRLQLQERVAPAAEVL